MANARNIEYKELKLDDLHYEILGSFNRYQETKGVKYVEGQEYKYKEDYFIDDWDEEKKKDVIKELRRCIILGGFVVAGIEERKLIGFANVEGEFFGKQKEYLELPYIHVSNEYRGKGIGKRLFEMCSRKSKDRGAKKLYIGAHPSKETQAFYISLGCKLAVEFNEEIYNREPLDIQMEFVL